MNEGKESEIMEWILLVEWKGCWKAWGKVVSANEHIINLDIFKTRF